MLHYLVEPHDDPVTWRDVEALPLFGFVFLTIVGVARIHQELSPILSQHFLKAVAIVALLGLRKILNAADDDVMEIAAA